MNIDLGNRKCFVLVEGGVQKHILSLSKAFIFVTMLTETRVLYWLVFIRRQYNQSGCSSETNRLPWKPGDNVVTLDLKAVKFNKVNLCFFALIHMYQNFML